MLFGKVRDDDITNNPKALAEKVIKEKRLIKEALEAGFTDEQVVFMFKHKIL